MKTYQDWLQVADKSDDERIAFVRKCINEHMSDPDVKYAEEAQMYDDGLNVTIMRYQKFIYNALGQRVPDYVSANHKIASNIFGILNTQAVSTQLGNGIKWKNENTEKKLQNKAHQFLNELMDLFRGAMVQKAAYGFWNLDHIEVFEYRNFKGLFDEEDGALKLGIRFWQIDKTKPLRATLFELDGYTELIWRKAKTKGEILYPKRPYILKIKENKIDGAQIYDGMNYPTFPIIPLYLNKSKTSTLVKLRSKIDAYDLIASGYVNDEDDMNVLYWTVTNAGGMSDSDLVEVLDKLRKLHMAQVEDDQQLQAHTVDMPYLGREAILDRLEKQIYKDGMGFDPEKIASGSDTATHIRAGYELLNEKLDTFEIYLTAFISKVLELAGIDDEPSYDRSYITNTSEMINAVLAAAQYLDEEYVTRKIMTLLGDVDQIDMYIDMMNAKNLARLSRGGNNNLTEGNENQEEIE